MTLYMGRIPELVIGTLACPRIRAVHSVVFGSGIVVLIDEYCLIRHAGTILYKISSFLLRKL